ncbi:hypothetical protein FB567DRAFT_630443 [Paraphoma chrysanthemicola]|uniref:Uncharacterized protein n=1 Tax=Paraphoma chrysanthemicola TaxID=798071 RepID=A0A8K0VWX5_9PLEO|nr:hypothetical protein FB567DRAFT_630443 [Paraphoma chrysanthemicola]
MEVHDVCAFSKNDLNSDEDHTHLSGSKQVIQPALRPFAFLELAVELRIEIYRYALTCSEPIASESNKLQTHEKDNPAVALLRTCKTILSEGSQVFYGENDFRFQHEDFFFIPKRLPEHNFRWLKQLTMKVPFFVGRCSTRLEKFQEFGDMPLSPRQKDRSTARLNYLQKRLFEEEYIKYSANDLVRKLFLHTANAPNLKQLNLAFRNCMSSNIFDAPFEVTENLAKTARSWLDNMQVLRDFKDLLTARPLLKIVLIENTSLSMQNIWKSLPYEQCYNRIAPRLKHIGVWDRRVVLLSNTELMYDQNSRYICKPIPQEVTAEDPEDFLLAMEPLFAGITYGSYDDTQA